MLAGCAARPDPNDPDEVAEFKQTNDPIEPFNRTMYAVHQGIDRVVLRPVAVAYRDVVPQPLRTGIRNVLGNLRTPVILANDMLQGEPRRAGDTLGRFLMNSTLGLGGIFDVAGNQFGVKGHSEDYGQTLAVWGVGEGAYLFIPVIGPSNPRDLTGFGLGIASDPLDLGGPGRRGGCADRYPRRRERGGYPRIPIEVHRYRQYENRSIPTRRCAAPIASAAMPRSATATTTRRLGCRRDRLRRRHGRPRPAPRLRAPR